MEFAQTVAVVRTKSNGSPGKGHSSVLDYFKQQSRFDYLVAVDGDDMLYPTALFRIGHYLQYQPDILFLTYQDQLTRTAEVERAPHLPIGPNEWLVYNFEEVMGKVWLGSKGINPFGNTAVYQLNTPGRMIVWSRKSMEYDVNYAEQLRLYDDYPTFMQVFELHEQRRLRIFGLNDSEIYLYNQLGDNGATKQFFTNGRDGASEPSEKMLAEEREFRKIVTASGAFPSIRDWDLTTLSFLQLERMPHLFSFQDKLQFTGRASHNLSTTGAERERAKQEKWNYELFIQYAKENGPQDILQALLQHRERLVLTEDGMLTLPAES